VSKPTTVFFSGWGYPKSHAEQLLEGCGVSDPIIYTSEDLFSSPNVSQQLEKCLSDRSAVTVGGWSLGAMLALMAAKRLFSKS